MTQHERHANVNVNKLVGHVIHNENVLMDETLIKGPRIIVGVKSGVDFQSTIQNNEIIIYLTGHSLTKWIVMTRQP